jgi:predicted dehydrogenase
VKRIHGGMIGDVNAVHITYLTGPLWFRKDRAACNSEMEYQMRNWYYYSWLSGDFIVEQHCHNFDKSNWVFNGEMPVSATGIGGRQVRTDPKYGNIYDHFGATFEYKSGAKLFSFCRQMAQCNGDVNDHVIGSKGSAQLMKHTISVKGGTGWELGEEPYKDMYQVEHDELFAGIRSGKLINDGENAAYSTLMAILAREAAYSGKKVAWKDLMESKKDLSPKQYAWGENPVPGVPMPGSYSFA